MNTLRTLSRSALALAATVLLASLATAQNTCPLLGLSDAGLTTSILWDINTTTGVPSNPRTVNTAPNRCITTMAFSPTGVLYGVSQGQPGDVPSSGKLYTIHVATGTPTLVATMTQFIGVEGDIAVDPTTGFLYAVDGIGPLFRINTITGVGTSVGSLPLDLPGGADYSALAFTSFGQMFVWSSFGQVVRKVNKLTAAIQSTVPIAPSPGGQIGGMAFDGGTGTCYLAAGVPGANLSKVNTSTGAVAAVGPLTGMNGIWALAFDPRNCATVAIQGKGCVTRFASFYERQSSALQDLSGMKVVGTFTGNGYVVTTVPGTGWFLPIGLAPLLLGDDTQVAAGTLGFHVGSNGWLARGPGNSSAPVPTVPMFLNQVSAQLSAWTDLDPSDPNGGRVYYDEPAPGVGRATYSGVFYKGTAWPNDVQITWDTNTNDWSMEYGVITLGLPHVWLTGYSPAGQSADPGPSDISTFGGSPLALDLFDTLPLTLTPVGRPLQGVTASPFNLITTNIDSTALMHIGIVGIGRPGIPLSGLGLPNDCFLYSTLDVIVGPHLFPGPIQPWNAVTLPALPPSFSGFAFNCQSATFTASGIGPTTRVSNGVKCVVGTL